MKDTIDIESFAKEIIKPLNIVLTFRQESILETFYTNCPGSKIGSSDGGIYDSLVLILGRRSGKNVLLLILALYEFYKIIHEQNYKNDDIVIFTHSKQQSFMIFKQLKELIEKSHHFNLENIHISDNSVTYNGKGKKRIIFCNKTNQAMGLQIHSFIVSDASYFSDEELKDIENIFQNNNNSNIVRVFPDSNPGKKIYISNASYKDSYLYKLYSVHEKNKLALRLPTWEVRPDYSKEKLLENCGDSILESKFAIDFGAEFSEISNVKETEQITFRLPVQYINQFKKIAREKAYKEDRDVIYTDVIRSILIDSLKG